MTVIAVVVFVSCGPGDETGDDAGSPETDAGRGIDSGLSRVDGGGVRDSGTTRADSGVTFDAGLKLDAGTDAGTPSVDSGVSFDASVPFDAGLPVDAGRRPDSGTPVDAGSAFDAGSSFDAGTKFDAGSPFDAGTKLDAGTPFDAGVPIFNACTEDKFIDRRGVSTTTVGFGGFGTSSSFTYSPACVVVSPGHEITFSGAFSSHPLSPGIFNNTSAGTANNPITVTNSGMASTFTFTAVGEYPYFCQAHGSFGMAGVVRVRQ